MPLRTTDDPASQSAFPHHGAPAHSESRILSTQYAQVKEAVAEIVARWDRTPRAGIILGTGMGKLAGQIQEDATFAYRDLPNFPRSTALSHKGQLVCGTLAGVPVVAMEGRCHLYEGYSVDQITLPVRVMQALGARMLVVGNASGGINPTYARGDIMVIDSHINLMFRGGLGFPVVEAAGRPLRTSDSPYDPVLIEQACEIARRKDFVVHRGVYVALTGPNYETRAEYRFLRRIGGDAVGMSTVPEVCVARELGLRVLALSTVTNVAIPDALNKTDAHEVVAAAETAELKLRAIVTEVLSLS